MSESPEYRLNGGIWWSLLSVLLFLFQLYHCVLLLLCSHREKDVTDTWIQKTNGLLMSIPTTLIWALLWLVCMPFTWGLLPWGEWSFNWWKIFPYGGLFLLGGLPLIAVLSQFSKTVRNPEFNYDIATAKPAQPATVLPTVPISQPTIELHEAVEHKPITFSVHNRPSSNDAWVGVYPVPRVIMITESDGSICVILARQLLPYPHNHLAITRSECFRMVATTWSPSINLALKNTIQQLTRFNQRSKKRRNLAPISGVTLSLSNLLLSITSFSTFSIIFFEKTS